MDGNRKTNKQKHLTKKQEALTWILIAIEPILSH